MAAQQKYLIGHLATKKWTLPPSGNLFGVQHIPRVHEAVSSRMSTRKCESQVPDKSSGNLSFLGKQDELYVLKCPENVGYMAVNRSRKNVSEYIFCRHPDWEIDGSSHQDPK